VCSDKSWLMSDCSVSAADIVDVIVAFAIITNQRIYTHNSNLALMRQCNESATPVFCAATQNAPEKCVPTYMDCFNTTDRAVAAIAQKQCVDSTDTGKVYCHINGCVERQTDCLALTGRCAADTPFRCRDWTCVNNTNGIGCGDRHTHCSAKEVFCPDWTCAPTIYECAKRMTWQGCSPGFIECPQKRGLCVKSLQQCVNQTGCSAGQLVCGMARDHLTLKPVLELYYDTIAEADANSSLPALPSWRVKQDCRSSCQTRNNGPILIVEPIILQVPLVTESASTESAPLAYDDRQTAWTQNRAAVVMRIKIYDAAAVKQFGVHPNKPINSSEENGNTVRFKVNAVSDSLQQRGSFKQFHERGTIRSIVTVEPLDLIQIVQEGVQMQLALPEDAAVDVDITMCAELVQGMQVISVQDASSLDKIPMFVQFCTPILVFMPVAQPTTSTSSPLVKGVCSCAIDLTHFTTFALVDVVVDDMLQKKNTPATVLVFFVFLPLHPTAFDENTRASFVLAVASVYSMSISNVQLLAVDLWPPDDMTTTTTTTSVSGARGTAGTNIPTTPRRRSLLSTHQSRLTVRISGTPAFTKKSTAALNVQLIIQGLPASLSGIVPQKITDSEAFPRQFILLACVAVLLMCCASSCTMCYLSTENMQTIQETEHDIIDSTDIKLPIDELPIPNVLHSAYYRVRQM